MSKRTPASPSRLDGARMLLGAALVALVAAGAAARQPAPEAAPYQPGVTVSPNEVQLNLFYHGASLRVTGRVAAGDQAVVLCTGSNQSLHLKRKGRVWGMWMNAGEVAFGGVPSVYLLKTSAGLEELGPAELLADAVLGYDGLRRQVAAAAETAPGDLSQFPELVRLKEHEGVFKVDEGALKMTPSGHGLDEFVTTFFLPARVPPAAYEIRLYAFRGGAMTEVGRATTVLEPAGAAAFIAETARRRGLLYGIVAVLVAMAAGLLTGLLFGLGGKRGQAH